MTETQTEHSQRAVPDACPWTLVERYCEHFPDDWRLIFNRADTEQTIEVSVPEEVWRAFDA